MRVLVDSLISLQCYQVPFLTILRLVSDIAAHFEPPNQSPLVRHKECTYDDSDQMVFHRNPRRPCLASDGLCNGVLQTIQKKINIGQAKCKLGIKSGGALLSCIVEHGDIMQRPADFLRDVLI